MTAYKLRAQRRSAQQRDFPKILDGNWRGLKLVCFAGSNFLGTAFLTQSRKGFEQNDCL